ncbi:MAG: hypothetical protein A3I92_02610 [Candidatus Yanofskybacteria bacterium RIFCSPLOWO2_02_FULL_43_10b]|uniref:Uncharacterized protein n=1 Tax=Candidatus Yanofskybacteria bacterium RIFCSPLOWO2_02_FULL_43_10b TaxID=1802704 RepID=A0A1F8H2W1_9BACT|nr:MAG: hypothetical protein A3I92_02610 [Candidatus Yanofskybacteria bacterium RIFCSPLOWO2_02_FULL_43_10b]
MGVEFEDFRIEEETLVAMLIDDIDIGIVGEDGRNKIAFVKTVVGGRDGERRKDKRKTENNQKT